MSTDDYTPTTEQVREAYHDSLNRDRSRAAFDRFLAAHDAALLAAHPATAINRETLKGIRVTVQEALDDPLTRLADSPTKAAQIVLALLASGVLGNTEGNNP